MASLTTAAPRIAGIGTCVPRRVFDNLRDATGFGEVEVRKVTGMAGVARRHVVDGATCTTDLCFGAAGVLFEALRVDPATIDALVLVTQTPDYIMPSSSCLLQQRLGLSKECAAFDVGLGCSGYVYGLWLAASMLAAPGLRRVLLLNGETPTLYADPADRSVSLLFGDAGSATILEPGRDGGRWHFVLRTDGAGRRDLIIEAGGFRDRFCGESRKHFVAMNGSNVFNFTLDVIPPLIEDTLRLSGRSAADIDYFILHQSNQFIMKHLIRKVGLAPDRVPLILGEFGNAGGPSVPLTMTQGRLVRPERRPASLMLLGYGVGLSWGSALVDLAPDAVLCHTEWPLGAPGEGGGN